MSALNAQPVRSRDSIIKGLLQRAIAGLSRYTPTEMAALIAERVARAREMSEEHEAVLAIVRSVHEDIESHRNIMLQAGLTEADIGPRSRGLTNLSIRERLMAAAGDPRLVAGGSIYHNTPANDLDAADKQDAAKKPAPKAPRPALS